MTRRLPRPAGHPAMAALGAALALAACAVTPARMALPEALSAAPPVAFTGLGFGRNGSFDLAGQTVRFERTADRLSFFDALSYDRAGLRFSIQAPGREETRATCRARRVEGTLGIVSGALRPFSLGCDFTGTPAGRLDLVETQAAAGTRAERAGRYTAGSLTLELRSVHELRGSALPLPQAAGYVLWHQGRPVAALELTDTRPLLRRAVDTGPLADAVTQAAVALALLWDPAATTP
jgi:hypothetical protein